MTKEFSEREIEFWAKKSDSNQKIYDQYIMCKQACDRAWKENDGASHTGWAVHRDIIRRAIVRRMKE